MKKKWHFVIELRDSAGRDLERFDHYVWAEEDNFIGAITKARSRACAEVEQEVMAADYMVYPQNFFPQVNAR